MNVNDKNKNITELTDIISQLPQDKQDAFAAGVHVGVVIGQSKTEPPKEAAPC